MSIGAAEIRPRPEGGSEANRFASEPGQGKS